MKVTYMLLGDRYVRLLDDDKKVQQLLNKIKDVNDYINKLGGYVYSLLTKVNNNEEYNGR